MIINPNEYYYRTGEKVVLTCLCEDGTRGGAPVLGRTIRVVIRRKSDNKFLDWDSGAWDSIRIDSQEKIMSDGGDGTYYCEFDQNLYDHMHEDTYIVTYIDRSETYTGTDIWGGIDFETLHFATAAFVPDEPADYLKVNVWGIALDSVGDPIVGAEVTAVINKDNVFYTLDGSTVSRTLLSTVTSATGYWDIEVFPNSTLSQECLWKFTINKRSVYEVNVPDVPSSIALTSLVPDTSIYPI